MTVEMKKYKLGNIADFDKKTLSKKDSMDVIEYLDTASLTENIFGPMQVISRQDAPSRAQRRVFDKTILYSTVRPRLKHYGFMEKPKENTIVSTGFVTIDVKDEFKNVIDPYYLYLLLIQDEITEYLGTIADTAVSSYPSLNPSDIQMLEFEFPDLSIQKKIASVLYNVDKRIENLRTQNRVLEQTAKTIYDYTFLQCAGHQTTYNKTLNRNIPADWEVKKLSEIANITMGQSPEGSSYNEIGNGKIFYQGCTDFGVMFPTPRLYTTAPTRFAKVNDILMSVRAPVGTLNIANMECCIGRGLAALNAKEGSNVFLYYVMKNFENHFKNAFSMGTTFGSITKNDLYDLPVLFPDSKTLELFSMQVSPLFKKQLVNSQQIETLTTQRNTLLPLLMTGQIEVV